MLVRLREKLLAAHQVHTLSQHDHDDAHIIGEAQQQATQILGVSFALLFKVCQHSRGELVNLVQRLNTLCNRFTIALLQAVVVGHSRREGAVKYRSNQGVVIQIELRKNICNMQDIERQLLPAALLLLGKEIEHRVSCVAKLAANISIFSRRQ